MTLVLGSRYSDDARILSQSARMQGWDVVRLSSSSVPEGLRGKECRVYAEGFLVEHIAEALGLKLVRPAEDILPKLGQEFLKRQVWFSSAADFKHPGFPVFIKPADQKLFPVGVYAHGAEIPSFNLLNPDDTILISEPVNFTREYRFFVLNQEIKTGSIYLLDEQVPNVPVGYAGEGDELWAQALAFAGRVCTEAPVNFPLSFALDVGQLDSGDWAVIELNPTWASGIYGCDPHAVLECLVASQQTTLKTYNN